MGPSQARKQTTAPEAEAKGARRENYYQGERESNDERGGRGGGARRGGARGRDSDRERQEDVRGRGGGRGWGRRNEFSNRNRYPDRRGSGEKQDYAAAASGAKREEKVEKTKEMYYQRENTKPVEDTRRAGEKVAPEKSFATATNSNANNTARKSTGRVPPPFTNTEYKGSESLATANSKPQQNVNERTMPPRQDQNEPSYNEDLDNPDREAFPRDGSNRKYNKRILSSICLQSWGMFFFRRICTG